jgi:methylase of polypeptide subunit release factors
VPDAVLTTDPFAIAAMRDALNSAGFSAPNLDALIGREALAAARSGDLAGALRATRALDPLSTLARLFVLGVEVEERAAGSALGALGVAGWSAAGLVTLRNAGVTACLRLSPVTLNHADLVVAHDAPGPAAGADAVLGVGPTAEALAALTIRMPSRRALDLGCGGGIQALLAARDADQVVATDVAGRAVYYCRFSVALNGVVNVECRLGDRFDPVEGDEFDLIVSNPPFVISPDTTLRFRDSGLPLDEMSRSVVRGAAAHLAPLGYAQVMASWPLTRGESWHERVHGWLAGSGCDAWVLQIERQSPDAYARRWLAHGGGFDPMAYERWLDSYERDGIEGFGYGLVTLRRAGHLRPWWRYDEVPNVLRGQPAAGLQAGFEAADWLLSHEEDDVLLAARLRVGAGARLESWHQAERGRWVPDRSFLRQLAGLPFSGPVSVEVARLIACCDGTRSLSDALGVVEWGGEPPARSEVLALVRTLVANSFLVPAPSGEDEAVRSGPKAR